MGKPMKTLFFAVLMMTITMALLVSMAGVAVAQGGDEACDYPCFIATDCINEGEACCHVGICPEGEGYCWDFYCRSDGDCGDEGLRCCESEEGACGPGQGYCC